MVMEFRVAERIEAESIALADYALCQVRLMDDRRYPWLLLLPRHPGLEEWTELGNNDLALLSVEIARAGAALRASVSFDKLNVGSLGNVVRQMHVHIVGRRVGDASWPDPVWGRGTREPYPAAERRALVDRLLSRLI